MSTILFGVDSAQPMDKLLGDVTKWAAGKPAVWGRYLSSGGGAAVPLTTAELDFARANGIAVIPIYNGAGPHSVAGGFQAGVTDALHAIALAEALRLPKMTMIVVDLEYGWPVSQAWLEGWCQQMMDGPYGYGIYGNLAQPYFANPYLAALKTQGSHTVAVSRAALWSASWRVRQFTAVYAPNVSWNPDLPGGRADLADRVIAWQCTGRAYGGIVDLDLVRAPLPNKWLFAACQPAIPAVVGAIPPEVSVRTTTTAPAQTPPPSPSGGQQATATTGGSGGVKIDIPTALEALKAAEDAIAEAKKALGS